MLNDRAAFFFYGTLRNPSWMRSFNAHAAGTVAVPGHELAPRGFTPVTHKLKGWSLLKPNGLGLPIIWQMDPEDKVLGTVAYVEGPLVPEVIRWLDGVESEGNLYDRVKLMATPVRYDRSEIEGGDGYQRVREEEGEPEEVSVYVPTMRFVESLAFSSYADHIMTGDWLDRSRIDEVRHERWAQT